MSEFTQIEKKDSLKEITEKKHLDYTAAIDPCFTFFSNGANKCGWNCAFVVFQNTPLVISTADRHIFPHCMHKSAMECAGTLNQCS